MPSVTPQNHAADSHNHFQLTLAYRNQSTMAPKLSAEDRLRRRRQNARVRQQRCRDRKRQAFMEGSKKEKDVVTPKHAFAVTPTQTKYPNHPPHPSHPRSSSHPSHPNHPSHHVSPRFPLSPRSVYTTEAWGPRTGAKFSQRLTLPFERHRSYSYDAHQQMETRYDSGVESRPPARYSRYEPPRRYLPPQFVPIQRPPPYYQYDREQEYYHRRGPDPEYCQPAPAWVKSSPHQGNPPLFPEERGEPEYRQKWTESAPHQGTPPLLEYRQPDTTWIKSDHHHQDTPPVLIEETPMKSKEEAAIDAILSLKTGKKTCEIVTPPQIKHVFSREQNDSSAFRRLSQQQGGLRPGFYMTVRIA